MELKVDEIKELSPIKFNYEEIKNWVIEKSIEYKSIVYTEDTIENAKTDRATLNKVTKAINDEKIRLKKDIFFKDLTTHITRFIDTNLSNNSEMYNYHNSKIYKEYCFDSLFPLEEDKIYKKDKEYFFRIRSINQKIANYFLDTLLSFQTIDIECLSLNAKTIEKKLIEKLYTITPILMKTDEGYWQYSMTFEDFEKRLKINCLKKYLYFTQKNGDLEVDKELLKKLGEDKSDDIDLFTNIKFINKKPITIIYKGRKLVGDKIELQVANNERAQDIAYMLLGTGLLENCTRGCGFLGFKFYE